MRERTRALKEDDVWIVDRISTKELVAKHRDLNITIRIPLNAVGRGLRRISYVNTMDVTNTSDYFIIDWFNGIRDMARLLLDRKDLRNFTSHVIEQWKTKYDSFKTRVLLAQRFNMSAVGTSLVSFYSDEPIIGTNQFWCIMGPRDNYVKILTLWMNSTINLIQMLMIRRETEGAWLQIDEYALKNALMPDPNKLSIHEVRELLTLFKKVGKVEMPSILEQLKEKHPTRKLIDETWLKILGYKGDIDSLLDRLYSSIADEIELLKKIMAEGVVEKEEDV
ncbi:MAG: hypothetical protein QXR44_06605 [Thermoproteota archaeon]|nr:hypothetical protein [Candidatus Brockarchaeota archaeon]